MVSIPGGEPLMHPQIDEIVAGLVARKKYIYLCTNALLLKEKLHLFKPSKYLTFSVHVDGEQRAPRLLRLQEGGYDLALDGMREAIRRGFRVTTNTTLFDGADPQSVRAFFDEMMDAGRRGHDALARLLLRQGARPAALLARRAPAVFRTILSNRNTSWQFNMSPLFLEFLMGKRNSLHSLGHADLQHLRLAEALLPAAGWLRRYVRGTDGLHRVGELRQRIRQSEVRQLHGALRLRSFRGGLHFFLQRRLCNSTRHAVLAYRDPEAARQVAAEKPKPSLVQIDAIAPRPTLKGTEVAVGGN